MTSQSREEKFASFASTDSRSQELKTRSIVGALFSAGAGVGDFVLRLVSTIILARLLVPEDFGLVSMVVAITAIADQFASLGLSAATIQAPRIDHKQASALFWINVAAGLIMGAAVFALAPVIADFYHEQRLVPITMAIAANFIGGGLTVQHEALLNRQMKQPQVAAIKVGSGFLGSMLAIGLALSGFSYWALVCREVSRVFLIAAGVWSACRWIPSLPSRNVRLGSFLFFARDMSLTQLLNAISSVLDSLLIGRFVGATALGLYRQGFQLLMAPLEQLNAPIHNVSLPALSMLQNDPERYRRYYERVLFVVSFVTVPIGAFSCIYAHEIVAVILSAKWIAAAPLLQVFGVAAAIRPAIATSGLVLVSHARTGRFAVIALVHCTLLGALMAFGVRWGAMGVAIASVCTSAILAVPKLAYSFEGSPVTVRGFLAQYSRPLFAALVMVVCLILLRELAPVDSGVVSLAVGCTVAALVYPIALAAVPGGWAEIKTLLCDLRAVSRRRPIASELQGTAT
jgi:O-antigen/teichoic acid export membrane protein